MKQFIKIFNSQLKMTFRDKGVWFWSICYPVLLLVIFLTVFGGVGSGEDDSFSANIALVAHEQTEVSQSFEQILRNVPLLEWKDESPVDREQAEEWLKEKDIDGFIVLPDGVAAKQLELFVNREKEQAVTTQMLSSILRDVVNNYGVQATPEFTLQTSFISSGSDKLNYSDFLLTGMIALSLCQAGLFGMVGMVETRRNGLLKRLKMTPVNMRLFGLGNLSVRLLMSAVQIALLSGIGYFFYSANFNIDVIAFILMFIVGTLAFTSMGFMVAAFAKSMDSYMGIVNLIGFLMMFLSGIFFDYTLLPEWLKPVADVLPLTFFVNGIRDSMVYGVGLFETSFWINFGVLLGWVIVTFVIGSRFYKWQPETR